MLTESFASRPSASETLTYTFDTLKLGIRTGARVGTGGAANWFSNVMALYSSREVAEDSLNVSPVTFPATGTALGAAKVKLDLDGIAIPDASS